MNTSLKQIKDSLFPTNIEVNVMFVDAAGRDTKVGKVYTVHINDDVTAMKMSVWSEEQIAMLKQGQKIRISKASVSIFQNEPQLSVAKDGIIEILKQN